MIPLFEEFNNWTHKDYKLSPHRLENEPIFVSDNGYIEFKVHSDMYGVTVAVGDIAFARTNNILNTADGNSYILDKIDWLEINTGEYQDNYQKALKSLRLDGTILYLDPVNIPDTTMSELKKEVGKIPVGHKWSSSKQGWIFDYDPNQYVTQLVANGTVGNKRQDLHFFQTPQGMVNKIKNIVNPLPGEIGLEPSCGRGAFLKVMTPGSIGIEIDTFNANIASKENPHVKVINGDFMQMDLGKFDYIMANPPFKHWKKHLLRMMAHLESRGRLCCILPLNDKSQAESLMKDYGMEWRTIYLDGSQFRDQGANQRGTTTEIFGLCINC